MKHHVIVKDGTVTGRGFVMDPETTKVIPRAGEQVIEIDDPSAVEIGHTAKKTRSTWSFTAPVPKA